MKSPLPKTNKEMKEEKTAPSGHELSFPQPIWPDIVSHFLFSNNKSKKITPISRLQGKARANKQHASCVYTTMYTYIYIINIYNLCTRNNHPHMDGVVGSFFFFTILAEHLKQEMLVGRKQNMEKTGRKMECAS